MINSEEGTLYVETQALIDSGSTRYLSLTDGTSSNRMSIVFGSSSNQIRFLVYNGVVQSDIQTFSYSQTDMNKIAFRYAQNNFSLWVNGVKVGENLSGDVFALNTLSFDLGNNSLKWIGKTKALAVYKTALTDASLRSLTYPSAVATTFDLDFDTIAEQFTFTRGSEATFVNAQGLIQSTASNDAPRLDYSTGAKAFLLEPQSTNLLTQSELFSDSYWIKSRASVTDNSLISPDGTLNASKFTQINSTAWGGIVLNVSPSGTSTLSIFAKKIDNDYIAIIGHNINDTKVYFNLDNGTIGTIGADVTSADIQDYGNGWFRCVLTALSINRFTVLHSTANNGNTANLNTETSLWGAMLEQQSYATSYIPTSGASATRNQELCNNATPVINSEEGTLYAEISALDISGDYRLITLSDGTTNNRTLIGFRSNTGYIYYYAIANGVVQSNFDTTITSVNSFSKIALKYKANDFALWVNGVEIYSDSSGSVSLGLDTLQFTDGNGTNRPFYGNTKGLKYYPKALADVQLQDLTTI